MDQSNRTNNRLSLFFVVWIILGSGLLLSPTATTIDYWLGAGLVWALLIPLSCLVWLNPRRSWGMMLAIAGTLLLLVLRFAGLVLPKPAVHSRFINSMGEHQ